MVNIACVASMLLPIADNDCVLSEEWRAHVRPCYPQPQEPSYVLEQNVTEYVANGK